MAGVQFIQHQGRRVLLLDYAGVTDRAAALALIKQTRALVATQPKRKELLVVVDSSRMTADGEVMTALQDLAKHNSPYVLASAICNPSSIGRVITRANALIANRRFVIFDDRQEALDWVVAQDPGRPPGG